MVVNFEDANFSTFRDFPKRSFCHTEIGDGSGGMKAICSRPEEDCDVIFSRNAKTVVVYVASC